MNVDEWYFFTFITFGIFVATVKRVINMIFEASLLASFRIGFRLMLPFLACDEKSYTRLKDLLDRVFLDGKVRHGWDTALLKWVIRIKQLLEKASRWFGSCVLKASAVECQSILPIYTPDRPLNQDLIDIPSDTPSRLYRHLINNWPRVERLIWISQKLVESRPTVNQDLCW